MFFHCFVAKQHQNFIKTNNISRKNRNRNLDAAESSWTFPGIFSNISRNLCSLTFPGIFSNIPWNVFENFPKYSPGWHLLALWAEILHLLHGLTCVAPRVRGLHYTIVTSTSTLGMDCPTPCISIINQRCIQTFNC